MSNFQLADALKMVPQGAESVFPKSEYDRRLAGLRKQMAAKGFDLVLLSGPENVFYLTGQQTPGYYTFQCLCVPQQGEPFHILRGLEAMNARLNTLLADIEGYADDAQPAAAVAASLKTRGWQGKRVAIDRNAWFLTVNLYEQLIAAFGPLLDASGMVEPLRRVKSRSSSSRWSAPPPPTMPACAPVSTPRAPALRRTRWPPPSWRPPSGPARNISAWTRS